jgi:hypothetical protein
MSEFLIRKHGNAAALLEVIDRVELRQKPGFLLRYCI